eukprot:gene29563-5913_t
MVQRASAVLWAVAAMACIAIGSADIAMLYSLNHHGVVKAGPDGDSGGPHILLEKGRRELLDAGHHFHERYLNRHTCASTSTCLKTATDTDIRYGQVGASGVGFHSSNTLSRSSSMSHCISSAYSMLAAVFPSASEVGAGGQMDDGSGG